MTKEPIMIDDVDVSECPHIEYEHKWWDVAGYERNSENVCALSFDKNADFEEDFLCQDNPNCYYKQLKRKEQECEKLKDELIDVKWKIEVQDIELNDKEEQLDQLKAENEKLKQYKASKQASYETMQIEWNEAKNEVKQLKEELENFKDDCKGCTTCIEAQNNERIYSQSSRKYKQALQEIKDYCNKYSQNSIGFKQQILQKCEVIDE